MKAGLKAELSVEIQEKATCISVLKGPDSRSGFFT